MGADRHEILARLTGPGERFEIRDEDVRGRRLPVFVNRHKSLGELLRVSAGFGERPYLVTEDSTLDFAEHLAQVAALAEGLRERYGVVKGDRVAICAANMPEWIVAFWATVCMGGIAACLNAMWAPPEIAHGIGLAEPEVILADARSRELIGDLDVPVLSLEEDLPALVEAYRGAALPEDVNDEDDPAAILFTSGTTGRAKGATHSHRNFVGACWFHLLNDALATELGMAPQPRRYLLVSPLFHISSLHNLAVVRAVTGDAAVIYRGRFDAERVLRLIEEQQVTNWGAMPTMLSRVVEHPRLDDFDLHTLRSVSINSAPSAPTLKSLIRERLPAAAAALGTSYGLTESTTGATIAGAAELADDPATVGRAVPTMRVEIRDDAGGPVPDGVEGEICLDGPLIMLGYWRDPAATAAATTPDGWFRTGDLGSMRDGVLRMSTRRSDLILRGAENVYPAEVEAQLEGHPAVGECVVLGLPHADLGEEVAAVVVVRAGSTVTAQELAGFLADRLARYKVPTHWQITTEPLPRNATGKVMRRELILNGVGRSD